MLGVDVPLGEPTRLMRFTYHARQAERYRDGRIFLAGDAAHLFPPGRGAERRPDGRVNLGWKLGAAVQGRAPTGLLDTYPEERHHAAKRTSSTPRPRWPCGAATTGPPTPSASSSRPSPATTQAARRSADDRRDRHPLPAGPTRARHPLAGALAPDLVLRGEQGETRVAALTPAVRPVLLDLAGRVELREAPRGPGATAWRA